VLSTSLPSTANAVAGVARNAAVQATTIGARLINQSFLAGQSLNRPWAIIGNRAPAVKDFE
jgi:hypothetical protein